MTFVRLVVLFNSHPPPPTHHPAQPSQLSKTIQTRLNCSDRPIHASSVCLCYTLTSHPRTAHTSCSVLVAEYRYTYCSSWLLLLYCYLPRRPSHLPPVNVNINVNLNLNVTANRADLPTPACLSPPIAKYSYLLSSRAWFFIASRLFQSREHTSMCIFVCQANFIKIRTMKKPFI